MAVWDVGLRASGFRSSIILAILFQSYCPETMLLLSKIALDSRHSRPQSTLVKPTKHSTETDASGGNLRVWHKL